MQLVRLGATFQVFFSEEVAAVNIIATDGHPRWHSESGAPDSLSAILADSVLL